MTGDEVQRALRAEELYRNILDLFSEHMLEEIGESTVRGRLDAIYSAGKIYGRITALTETATYPAAGEVWRNRHDAQDVVEILSVSPALIVHFRHVAAGRTAAVAVYQFTELYELAYRRDRLIEDWQKIVDSVD